MQIDRERTTEARSIVSWRRDRLIETGFPPGLAAEAATDAAYDVHALIELAERGCPPDLAVRILAPLTANGAGA